MASKKEIQKAIKDRIKRFNNLWKKETGLRFDEDPNDIYEYEMSVINEAENIAYWFMDTYKRKAKQKWEEFAEETNKDVCNFIDKIKEEGYDKWYDGHSGNSGGQAISFAFVLLFQTELFPYMHGALSPMIGDEGYHDNRADVKEALEKYKEKHPENNN